MSKTFIVEVTVHDGVYESLFGQAMVKGLQFGDLHMLSYLNHNIQDITVRPWQEPAREWEVVIAPRDDGPTFTFGFKGTEQQAIDAASEQYPGSGIVGTYLKPE